MQSLADEKLAKIETVLVIGIGHFRENISICPKSVQNGK